MRKSDRLRRLVALPYLIIVALLLSACGSSGYWMEENSGVVTFGGPTYRGGAWEAKLEGFERRMEPGDTLKWHVDFSMWKKNATKGLWVR